MTKNKTNLLILIVLTTLFVFTVGYSAWIIINVKEADTPLDYNYRDIVYSAYNGQSEDYNHGEELQPNPEKNGYDLTIIDANTFTFKHRLKDITPTPEWTLGLPKNAGTYEILILSDNFSSTDEELIVTFTINPISPVKEYGPVIAFTGEDYNLIYTTFDGYNGTIGDPQYYDEYNNLLSEKPNSQGNYTAKILFGESDNFKETLLEIPIVITDTINVDPSELSVTVTPEKYTYTGSPITPTIEVTLNGSPLDSQYYEIINLQNNTNVGQASFTVNLKSGYEGTLDQTFIISPRELTPMPLEISYVSTIRKFTDICNNQILNNTVDDSGNITGGLILVDAEDRTTQYKANGIVTVYNMHNGTYGYGTFDNSIYEETQNVVGSTYLVTLSVTNTNYTLTDFSFILKYKTVLLGNDSNTYYTIEDALEMSGDIHLAGSSSYVMTSFTTLEEYGKDTFTLTNRKLVVPCGLETTDGYLVTQSNPSSGSVVYSVLNIPNGIHLNVDGSSSVFVEAEIGASTPNITVVGDRGIIMNNGILEFSDTSKLYSYGYIKGIGSLVMNKGTTARECIRIYDWPGGSAASDIKNTVFPSKSWSINNIACDMKIYSGVLYQGFIYVYLTVPVINTVVEVKEPFNVLSTDSSNALFVLTTDNGYVIKTTSASNNALLDITGSHQVEGQRVKLEIYSDITDGHMKLSLPMNQEASTSPSVAAPLSYLDVKITSGFNATLGTSSYIFMPGASLVIDEGSTVTLLSGSYMAFVEKEDYTEISATKQPKSDAYCEVNGTLKINGTLMGYVTTNNDGAILDLSTGNSSGVYVVFKNSSTYSSLNRNSNGLIYYNGFSCKENDFVNLKYYGIKGAWCLDSGELSYNLNGGTSETISNQQINIINGNNIGYILTSDSITSIIPTREGYDFAGWYMDSNCSDDNFALGQTVYTNTILYAKWDLINYQISYEDDNINYDDLLLDGLIIDNYNVTSSRFTLPILQREGYTFGGWYLDVNETIRLDNNYISPSIIKSHLGSLQDIKLYIKWISNDAQQITVNYILGNGLSPLVEIVSNDDSSLNSYKPITLDDYDDDNSYQYYFDGWYIDENCTMMFNNIKDIIVDYNVTLYAKWLEKYEINLINENVTMYYKPNSEIVLPDNVQNNENLVYFTNYNYNSTIYYQSEKDVYIVTSDANLYSEYYFVITSNEFGDISGHVNILIRDTTITFNKTPNIQTNWSDSNASKTVTNASPFANKGIKKLILDNATLPDGVNNESTKSHKVSGSCGGSTTYYIRYYYGIFDSNPITQVIVINDDFTKALPKYAFSNISGFNASTIITSSVQNVGPLYYPTDDASSSTSNSAYESSTTDGQTTVVTLFNNQKFDQSIKLNAVHVIIIITMMSSMILIFVKIRKNKKRVI